MKSLLLILSATACLAPASPWAWEGDSDRLGGFVGVQGAFLDSYGAVAELDYADAFAIQLEYYRYSEYQGIFPRDENLPYQHYLSRGVDIGYYLKYGRLKAGIFTGAEYVTGVIRGKFLREDSTYTLSFGGDGQPYGLNRYFEEVRLDDVLIPLKITLGIAWEHVGVDFSPKFYYSRGNLFLNLPVGIEFGWL